MTPRPLSCRGCPLDPIAQGFALPEGPTGGLTIFGEALGEHEAIHSRPFIGPAGGVLNRIFRLVGQDRSLVRIHNIISCRPPENDLVGASYEAEAISHCNVHRRDVISDAKVILALGATATRTLLNLPKEGHKQEDWHGCPVHRPDGVWVIPSFHPSYLLQGKQKLLGTVCWDYKRALEVLDKGWVDETASLHIDDPNFCEWVDYVLSDGWEYRSLAVDIETTESFGKDETATAEEKWEIVRINFSVTREVGFTVPFAGSFLPLIARLLRGPNTKIFWNKRYDIPRLRLAGMVLNGDIHDAMDMWHVLQSDLPRGLGFVAPFYSDYGPWKHLATSEPEKYAAIDAVQTIRCYEGIKRDLISSGLWNVYERHVHDMDTVVLEPASEVGLLVDREYLHKFGDELGLKREALRKSLESAYPESLRRLVPKGGWKKPHTSPWTVRDGKQTYTFTPSEQLCFYEEDEINVCMECGVDSITIKHRCADKSLEPKVVRVPRMVARYYIRLPFNPNSGQQIRLYMADKNHRASSGGKGKKGKAPTTDKKVLAKLATIDKFYQDILDFHAIDKVKSTYVDGTENRLKTDGAIHTTFTHKPSTMRLSSVDPNLQNVVTDRS